MNKRQKRQWAKEKSRRQFERRDHVSYYESETPIDMLRVFLPETKLSNPIRLVGEPKPEIPAKWWQRLWRWLAR